VKRDHSEDLDVDGDNIKIDLREIGQESVDWMNLTLVNAIMNLRVL
jgi:hypothetical protein